MAFHTSLTWDPFLSAPDRGRPFCDQLLEVESNTRWLVSAMLGPVALRAAAPPAYLLRKSTPEGWLLLTDSFLLAD